MSRKGTASLPSRRGRRQLTDGVVFLLLCVAAIFLTKTLAKLPDAWKYTGLLVLVIGAYFLYRSISAWWGFIKSVGYLRLIVATSLVLGLTVAAMALADTEGASFQRRAGRAAEHLLAASSRLAGQALQTAADAGRDIGAAYIPAWAEATPVFERPITIGDRVVVDRISGQRLLARSKPGVDHDVITRFDKGSTLLVIDGPKTADGYTWWKLKGEAGEGWCAEDALSPVAAP